jgi:hypothetical protein
VVWPQNHWDGFSWISLKIIGDGFFRFGLNTDAGGFLDLDLKTDNYGLLIWAPKSPRWFVDLCLKTKRAMICQLFGSTNRTPMVGGVGVSLDPSPTPFTLGFNFCYVWACFMS